MTPIRLELRHFMSHVATDIDYDGARLSVLVGENGAGKSAASTEAIEWVLFGKSRLATDDLVTWGETEMSVNLTFAHGGARYRVTRGRSLRSGGKSFAELQIATEDGWQALTGHTIAETQAIIERLLGMDHATFRTSVLLKQSDLARFAKATAGERKRILSQVLGLEAYDRAEARARELARDLERDVARSRADVEALADELARRPDAETALAHWTGRVASIEDELATAEGNRTSHERRLREIAHEQAAAAAAQADVTRLRAELDALKDTWRRAHDRHARAAALADRLAAAKLTGKELPVADTEAALGRAQLALAAAQLRLDEAVEPHRAAVADFEGKRAGLVHTEAELSAAVAGLAEVVCRKCGERQPADPADLAGRLHAARQALLTLPEPTEPLVIGAARGQLARRESDVRDAERALAASRLAEARADMAAAAAERAAVEETGRLARDQLAAAEAKSGGGAALEAERRRLDEQLRNLASIIGQLARERTEAATARGRAEQALEAIATAEVRHAALTAALAGNTQELGRLRKLATAFGPNGIQARIIESILPEFGAEATAILADTLPGWGIELRAQRARKGGDGMIEALDLVVLRDGAERPFEAASGGQQTILVLALALALSRISSRRTGSPNRFFGVDEPDGLDVERRRLFGNALRTLAHRGELDLISLVTHNEDLAEFGDRIQRVSVNGKGSVVEVVA